MKTAILTLLLLLLIRGAGFAQSDNPTGCIEEFQAGVDYFPRKAEVLDAANFTVSYHDYYKVIRVADAFDGAPPLEYALVQCGAPMPPADNFADNAQFIEIPAGRLITLTTTQLPALIQLHLLDMLVAVDSGFYISAEAVRERIADGRVAEVGFGSAINIELALELTPDLVISYGFNPATDAHPALLEAGIFTALDASWRESSPLGRAEWLKFPALFYNREAQAENIYADMRVEYLALAELTELIPPASRPRVLLNSFLGYADAWHIPGADTYVGQLMHAAGANLLLSQAESDISQPYSFEAVYEAALDADIWLLETFGVTTTDDLLALDSRFGDFVALDSGEVWNNNRDENANGGNNYYEWGVTNPQWILADLVAIFHPDLLPAHDFRFYRRLSET